MPRDFGRDPHELLVRFWNEDDGGISWIFELEAELRRYGYTTRKKDGTRNCDLVPLEAIHTPTRAESYAHAGAIAAILARKDREEQAA